MSKTLGAYTGKLSFTSRYLIGKKHWKWLKLSLKDRQCSGRPREMSASDMLYPKDNGRA